MKWKMSAQVKGKCSKNGVPIPCEQKSAKYKIKKRK